ncbi:hypothetical protein B0H17DRAFT_305592 [Mycena rosella]|uniref:Transmembrane protein n=1 Tax=Mycena rosella TaxID=1033263 RepID=A0AAD7DU79_MYCRO|nr:hypothetical protein B0H17DRAFT_305592 [Mycena rosella]
MGTWSYTFSTDRRSAVIFHRSPALCLWIPMSSSATFSTIIDDRDSTVSYTGTWVVGGTSHENDGTVSSSVKAGDHLSVPFTGTAIAVYGTFDSSSTGVKTSYAIDGGSPTIVTSRSSGADSYKQLFWKSDPVSDKSQCVLRSSYTLVYVLRYVFSTLVVTMLAVNKMADGEGTIWFDYFNATSDASTSSPSSGSSSSSSSAHTSTDGSSSPNSNTIPTNKSHSHSAVIAAVVAVIIFLAIFAGLLILLRRKRRRQKKADFWQAASISPYAPPPSQIQEAYTPPPLSFSQSKQHGPLSLLRNVAPSKRQQQVDEQAIGAEAPPPLIQHVDSGVRALDPDGPGLTDLPPVYSPH